MPVVVGAIGTIPRGLVKGPEDLEIRGRVETIQITFVIKIGQNTEKSLGDLRRLTVTQTRVKKPLTNARVENSKRSMIIIIIIMIEYKTRHRN